MRAFIWKREKWGIKAKNIGNFERKWGKIDKIMEN